MPRIVLACLDMAGTTVSDDGVVEKAFTAAAQEVGLADDPGRYAEAMQIVRETMGQSKIDVFSRILGDEDAAQAANAAFERAYADMVADGAVAALPDARETLVRLRDADVRVCLITGFAPGTRIALLAHLGWESLVDLALSPADAGRGRPWPDMIQSAAWAFGVEEPSTVAVVGDTPSDIRAGLAADAGIVAGVLTGAGTRDELTAAGATHVLDSIAELPDLLLDDRP